MKGPDVMAKSKQTQERYAQAFRGQGKLTGFGFKAPSYPVRVKGLKTRANPPEPMRDVEPDQSIVQLPTQPPVPISDEQPEIELSQTAGLSRTRSASVLSDPSTDGEATAAAGLDDVDEMAAAPESGDGDVSEVETDEEDIEDWEADLDEGVQGPESHIHDWADLRKEIKDHL
jgi:hypothetical protein